MKKTFWLGLAFAVAFSAGVSLVAFAKEAETNCINDPTGMTNCGTQGDEQIVPEKSALGVDTDEVSFGRITELGRRYSKIVTISNNTEEKAIVRVETITYEEGMDESRSALDWVAFAGGKRKFEIKAGGKLQLGVYLMVPGEVAGGTYYAKIKVSNGKDGQDKYVTVRADIATEDYKYGGEITSQSISFVNLNDKISASASLKNSGTAGFKAKYVVNYKNTFGLPEWKSLKEEYIEMLPGKELSFSIEDREAIGYGLFTVEQKISYIDANSQAKEAVLSHAVVNLPWWSLAVAGGVIVLIIVIVVIMKTRRKKAEQAERKEKAKKSKKKVTVEVEEDE